MATKKGAKPSIPSVPSAEQPTPKECQRFKMHTGQELHRVRPFNPSRWGIYALVDGDVRLVANGKTREEGIDLAIARLEAGD